MALDARLITQPPGGYRILQGCDFSITAPSIGLRANWRFSWPDARAPAAGGAPENVRAANLRSPDHPAALSLTQVFTRALGVQSSPPTKDKTDKTLQNTNRLLRQYLPKGTDLSVFSQAKLSAIARHLNERPRKTLHFHTPAEMFAQSVAAIH